MIILFLGKATRWLITADEFGWTVHIPPLPLALWAVRNTVTCAFSCQHLSDDIKLARSQSAGQYRDDCALCEPEKQGLGNSNSSSDNPISNKVM